MIIRVPTGGIGARHSNRERSRTLHPARDAVASLLRVPRRLTVLAGVLALLAAAAPAHARPLLPSVPACALGAGDTGIQDFYTARLARAEWRFGGPRDERRTFSAAAAAYVYGLAPVAVRQTVRPFPANQLVSIGDLVDPGVRTIVFPNVDTTYSVGRLDLKAGPVVIDVPNSRGRYYVIQLLDAYSNTFSYIGRRTTGTRPGSYAIVPRGYTGALPDGVRRIESPTGLVWVLGRTLVRGAADLPAATRVMSGYRVTGLASWAAGERQAPLLLPAFPPTPPLPVPVDLSFYDALGAALAETPAAARRRLRPARLRERRHRPGSAAERRGERLVACRARGRRARRRGASSAARTPVRTASAAPATTAG